MGDRKARIVTGMSAWLLILIVSLTQAQRSSDVRTQPAVFRWPNSVVVAGAVRSPARFELRRNVHLTELLAYAGGLSPDAKKTINIYRLTGEGEIRPIRIDLKAIKNRRAEDPIIQPHDIVHVLSKSVKNKDGDCLSPLCFMDWLDKLDELPLQPVE